MIEIVIPVFGFAPTVDPHHFHVELTLVDGDFDDYPLVSYRGRESSSRVAEAIADVKIMLNQLKLIYGAEQVKEAKRKKLHRLDRYL